MIRKVIQQFNKLYKTGLSGSTTQPCSLHRVQEYHPSSSPYCGLEDAYTIMKSGGPVLKTEMSAMMDFYCSVGTTMHEHLQKWLGKVAYDDVYIIGDFKCTQCGHFIEFTEYQDCPKCGHEMQYEELSVKFGHNTVGHVDCLLCVTIGKEKHYIVLDYKSSSMAAILQHNKSKKFPYAYNQFQIETYVALLEDQFAERELKISGWVLVYISRDAPSNFVPVGEMVDEEKKKQLHAQIAMWDKQSYYVYQNIRVTPEVFEFKKLAPLVKHKLCPTKEFYLDRVKGYEPCPLEKHCFGNSLVDHLRDVHAAIEPIMTTVVHCKRDEYDVYIGRKHKSGLPQSIYANPFIIDVHGTREEVVDKYRRWLNKEIQVEGSRPPTIPEVLLLRGKKLGCWCKGGDVCHGAVLADICNNFQH
jgi:hypothetical protein